MSWIMAGIAAVGAVTQVVQAVDQGIKSKQAKERAEEAEAELDRQKEMLDMLDTSNPYMNMENAFEDLTVNMKQAEFERSQSLQSQANIMDQFREVAGSSGIASLAQSLAQQGQLQAQQSAASIGQQEAAINQQVAAEASRLQGLEREGEVMSREMEFGKLESKMGLTAEEIARERQLQYGHSAQAAQSTQGAVEGLGNAASTAAASGAFSSDRKLKTDIKKIGRSPSGLTIYSFKFIDKSFGEGVWQGVMSDEVPQELVIKDSNGYDMVDYSKLDVEFKQI